MRFCRLCIATSPKLCTNFRLGVSNSDESLHCVLLTRSENRRKVGDVAGFETDHLYPFVFPRSDKARAFSIQGFQTTVVREFSFVRWLLRRKTGSSNSTGS